MKSLALLAFLSVSLPAFAAPTTTESPPQRVPYDASTPAGPHHRFHPNPIQDPVTGQEFMGGYVEIASGLNFRTGQGQWLPTMEEFQIVNGHAVAASGPHQVILSNNPKQPGAVDLLTPDGHRLRGHVLGLSLYNPTTGASELIAEVQDCVGELISPNQVQFHRAFDTIDASIRYTYKSSGLEQDIIFHEQPSIPIDFQEPGCRIEVMTEWLELPPVQKTVQKLKEEKDAQKRAAIVEPDLEDEHLDFGEMSMGPGRAFALGAPRLAGSIPVAKRLVNIEGRTILFEAVEIESAREELEKLPLVQAFWQRRSLDRTPSPQLRAQIPPAPERDSIAVAGRAAPIEQGITRLFAQNSPAPGFVIDWEVVSSVSGMRFKGYSTPGQDV
ncbi:MAG: hypothetical protein FJ404_09990 [Verrucomicrobia bacterium]|nr:hypothetical protein [Verrucomicrobiota bacterium]